MEKCSVLDKYFYTMLLKSLLESYRLEPGPGTSGGQGGAPGGGTGVWVAGTAVYSQGPCSVRSLDLHCKAALQTALRRTGHQGVRSGQL